MYGNILDEHPSVQEIVRKLGRKQAVLTRAEVVWRDRQPFLQAHGYMLRSRYRPGWTASWTLPENINTHPDCFEDSIPLPVRIAQLLCYVAHNVYAL